MAQAPCEHAALARSIAHGVQDVGVHPKRGSSTLTQALSQRFWPSGQVTGGAASSGGATPPSGAAPVSSSLAASGAGAMALSVSGGGTYVSIVASWATDASVPPSVPVSFPRTELHPTAMHAPLNVTAPKIKNERMKLPSLFSKDQNTPRTTKPLGDTPTCGLVDVLADDEEPLGAVRNKIAPPKNTAPAAP